MFRAVREQIDTIFREDPAAKSVFEVVLCYPGFHAILLHRFAHRLYRLGPPIGPANGFAALPLLNGNRDSPRRHDWTALLHRPRFGRGHRRDLRNRRRRAAVPGRDPGRNRARRRASAIRRSAIASSSARAPRCLGNIRIGDNVKIGAGSVVVHPVPDNSTVVGIPGRVVRVRPEGGPLEHGRLPDPEGQAMDDLARRVAELEETRSRTPRIESILLRRH